MEILIGGDFLIEELILSKIVVTQVVVDLFGDGSVIGHLG